MRSSMDFPARLPAASLLIIGHKDPHGHCRWATTASECRLIPRVNSAGQGTSIVEARVRKLGATVQVTDAHRGTRVSIVHA
jgi:hypothetical protein